MNQTIVAGNVGRDPEMRYTPGGQAVVSNCKYRWWRYQAVGLIALVAVVSAACSTTAPTPVTSPFGPMALYESAEHPFSIQYPAEWIEHPDIQNDSVPVWRTGSQGEWFVVVRNTVPDGETLSAYVDWVISADRSSAQHEMVSREQTKTAQGLTAELLEFTISYDGKPMTVNALIYLHGNGVGVRTAYGVPTSGYEDMKDMIAYSFSTFHVTK